MDKESEGAVGALGQWLVSATTRAPARALLSKNVGGTVIFREKREAEEIFVLLPTSMRVGLAARFQY